MSGFAAGVPVRRYTSRAAIMLMTFGGVLLALFVIAAVAAPLIAPYDPNTQVTLPFSEPSRDHLLGADDLGQDLLSQLIYGARASLAVGIGAAFVAAAVATIAGLAAGFRRGWLDVALMRLVDLALSLPLLPLLLVLSAFFEPGRSMQALVIGLILAPRPAREIRSQVLAVARLGPVDAARSMGAGPLYLLSRHILPATVPVIVAQFVRAVATAVVFESSLSFLGLGDPASSSWGTILFFANGRGVFLADAWLWWVLPPGLCIGLTVLAFAFLGFGLEERSDPRLRATPWRLSHARERRRTSQDIPDPLAPLLVVDHLTVEYDRGAGVRALDSVSLSLRAGELLALVGPSGSGKSTLAAAILGLLRFPGEVVAGRVLIEGRNIAHLSAVEQRRLRGNVVALVPQAAMNALNPVISVVDQVEEAVLVHKSLSRGKARMRALELLTAVGLPAERADAFPYQLSGGMRQRVAIAMAIAHEPRLIVADEPTTGLDTVAQVEILALLQDIRERSGAAMIVVTHDWPAMIMSSARVVELAGGQVLEASAQPLPDVLGCTVSNARPTVTDMSEPLLRVSGLQKAFPSGELDSPHQVLSGLDLNVSRAEIVGLVGRSGTGKTTLARILAGLSHPDGGRVTFGGVEILHLRGGVQRASRRELQFVDQDPYGSLSPRMSVRRLVAEPLVIHGISSGEARAERVQQALTDVGLRPASRYLDRFPHELSGGERQRVAFARAIVLTPALIVADEPASMLDPALRYELVQLMDALRGRRGMAWLYITHDIALARAICDRIVTLEDGRIVEECAGETLGHRIHHPATQRLLDAAQILAGH